MKKINWVGLLLVFLGLMQNANAKFSCEVRHSLHHGDIEIISNYRFMMEEDVGVILINGTAKSGTQQYVISREVHFNYIRKNGDNYLFTSKKIHKNPIDTLPQTTAAKHYPLFFIEPENSLTFLINPVNKTDYIISFVSTPLFYCNGD